MGWLDIFKARKEVITGFDFDDLERIFESLYLKSLAVDKSAEFVARIFAKSEFRYMVKTSTNALIGIIF